MTKIAAYIVFGFFYNIIYITPIAVLLGIYKYFILSLIKPMINVEISNGIEITLIVLILFIFFILVPFRTKFAVDEYGNRDKKFLQAHYDSKYAFRMQLSFIPIIGVLFRQKRNK